ncbi:MAG TPA: DUF885 domain-containing protein [Blastocatellia bacterium]|nr:DUF885 domain-containing protein [Blastocatellia bacterium]
MTKTHGIAHRIVRIEGRPRNKTARDIKAIAVRLSLLFCLTFVTMPELQPIRGGMLRVEAFTQSTENRETMAAAQFKTLETDYINDLHSRHPSLAATSGIHTWDGQLEDYSSGALASEIGAIKSFEVRLEKIEPITLDFSDIMDYQILQSNMKSRLLELEQIKSYTRNPQIYSDLISNGLLLIAMFDYAPAETRLAFAVSKEKQVPRLLDAARANVRGIPAAYLKISLESLRGTLSFIQNDLPKAFGATGDQRLQTEFEKSTRTATAAIESYIKQLEHTKPDPNATFAIGKANYEAKLKYDEGIDIPVEALLKIAYRELDRTQEAFRKTAALIDPRRDPMKVWAEVQADHPKAGTLVAEATKQLQALVQFIKEHQIVTLPEGEAPEVTPTPDFMRWSTASMWAPGPFEESAIPARYFVTDVDPAWTDKQKEEYLASINFPQLWTTSIHEAYPGHFVQAEYLKQVHSVVRRTWAFAPGSFIEGWAHYTEQMMIDEGFGQGDPKIRLGQLADALLRLCRFVGGIKEHTQGMSVEQATRFFMNEGYMGETPARIEAERGTFDPTYLVYTVGKLAILKLRDDYKRYRGKEFSLREFHDHLLSDGIAPMWVHRQMLMPGDKGKLLE